ISFHLSQTGLMTGSSFPLVYSLAMGIDAIAALIFGKLYDRIGLKSLMFSTILSSIFAPLAFLTSSTVPVIAGIICWGIGLGAQESIAKAVIASLTSADRRATAYGIFNAIFGLAWFAGSALMGFLYQKNIIAVALFSVAVELAAAIFFYLVNRQLKRTIANNPVE
ncbi:MAG TPA: MFS transporter, partial [Candidatus Saccharicenans sp.]|nr:MFS transporter [Candidatus Saccharicenans sp.]